MISTGLDRPDPASRSVRAGDIVFAVREDGRLVTDRVLRSEGPAWFRLHGRNWDHPADRVVGVYATHLEADAALEDVRRIVDLYGDENDLLHPVPVADVALRLMHDGHGVVTLHPDDAVTRQFVMRRQVFFTGLMRSFPAGQKLTDITLRNIAAAIAQRVTEKWREVGRGCRVEVGEPHPIVATFHFGASD